MAADGFEKWWNNFMAMFKDEEQLPSYKIVAFIAWHQAIKLEKQKSRQLIDTIVCSDGSHEFYKKHPHLK
jgi:hypothetical protein